MHIQIIFHSFPTPKYGCYAPNSALQDDPHSSLYASLPAMEEARKKTNRHKLPLRDLKPTPPQTMAPAPNAAQSIRPVMT